MTCPDLTSAEWGALLKRIKRDRLNDAAPELLEAAKAALVAYGTIEGMEAHALLTRAIAKAEGGA